MPDLPEPLHHVLLLLAVGTGVEDEPPGEVRLVVAHEDVLVLDVLEHQQHVRQLGLHLVTRQALEGGQGLGWIMALLWSGTTMNFI